MGDDGVTQTTASGVEDPCWLRVMELASLCSLPMALKAAVKLNVFEILAQQHDPAKSEDSGQLSAAQMVSRMPNINPSASTGTAASLDRILRLLAAHSILTTTRSSSTAHYGLTPLCKYLIPDGSSLSSFVLLIQDRVLMDTWQHLEQGVVGGGEPFTAAHGKDAFAYAHQDARFDKLYNSAMACHTRLLIAALLHSGAYRGFHGLTSLVDVGGGLGSCLHMIASAHPHITAAINFDQPHVIASAPPYAGVQHVAGDMFASIPEADAVFMKGILHDWSDEQCLVILKNCYTALPSHGKVIVVDSLIPTEVDTSLRARVGYQLDLLVFAYYQGGRERTEQEFQELAKAAGFARIQAVCKLNETNVLEFYKS